MLPFEFIKDTPYLALSGELWSVFYEYFNINWSCYRGFLLYLQPYLPLNTFIIARLVLETFSRGLARKAMRSHPDNKVHGANMGPTWVLRYQIGPMLAPWTLLSGHSMSSLENVSYGSLWDILPYRQKKSIQCGAGITRSISSQIFTKDSAWPAR